MNKFALIGYPISQSLSPIIFDEAFKSLNMQGTYELLETDKEDIVTRIKYLKTKGYDGFNVTIPHKVTTTLFVEQFDEWANLAGCVNCVKILPDKTLFGYNTDIYGFYKAIPQSYLNELKDNKVAILGTGGAARAVAIALSSIIGIKEIDFYARNIINSLDTVKFFRGKYPQIKFSLKQLETLRNLEDCKMLVNSTPIGMKNKAADFSPIDETILKTLAKNSIVYDLVYNPVKTKFIKMAHNNNYFAINGLDMLIYQAQRGFEIFTGQIPDFSKMKIKALEFLASDK